MSIFFNKNVNETVDRWSRNNLFSREQESLLNVKCVNIDDWFSCNTNVLAEELFLMSELSVVSSVTISSTMSSTCHSPKCIFFKFNYSAFVVILRSWKLFHLSNFSSALNSYGSGNWISRVITIEFYVVLCGLIWICFTYATCILLPLYQAW